jgi:16S rRNA U516 pseudouridylate synthase RsuA-like enzyme
MFADVGCEVLNLQRVSFGPLQLGDLGIGERRYLGAEEVAALFSAVEL